MTRLGAVIAQAIVHQYGHDEFLARLAHPFWFQPFGLVLALPRITTSVVSAIKRGWKPLEGRLGVHGNDSD